MDTKQLNTALNKIFFDDDARIVFWNDPQQEFNKAVENLGLDGIEVIRLDQAGSIATKLRIERDEPNTEFLLYAPDEVRWCRRTARSHSTMFSSGWNWTTRRR